MNTDNPNTFPNQDQEEIHNAPEPTKRESDFDEIDKEPFEDDNDGFATEDDQLDDDIEENPDLGSSENEEVSDARYGDDYDSDDDDPDGSRITERL